jgi:transketolase
LPDTDRDHYNTGSILTMAGGRGRAARKLGTHSVNTTYFDADQTRGATATFGASTPVKELQRKFGFEPERGGAAAKELLGRK